MARSCKIEMASGGVTKRNTTAPKRNKSEIFTHPILEVIACIQYEDGTTRLANRFLRKSLNKFAMIVTFFINGS
jgi:hypothetical protein